MTTIHMSPLHWKVLDDMHQFDELLENSISRPALVFKHRPTSPESISVKQKLEENWNITSDELDMYILDEVEHREIASAITETAGVEDEFPQVLLFADGVTMYDEAHDMINVKKIKIALKIINRTFKWMESRA